MSQDVPTPETTPSPAPRANPDATSDTAAVDLTALLGQVTRGGSLTVNQAEGLFSTFMTGDASPVQMAAFLSGLQAKGVEPTEVAGGVRALRGAMIPVRSEDPDALVDTAGTGGGNVITFNISTAAAFVAAGAGVPLAKHGNRSFTSRSGSADVLEALGVCIDLTPEMMGDILEEIGIVFMFAPLLHPAMRHVGPVRRELGVPTLMNLLGPLTNPAGARRQVVGVADPGLLDLIVHALAELGHARAIVVHGSPGMDELSPCGPTEVAELRDGEVRRYQIEPDTLGVGLHAPGDLAGGEPIDNAGVIRSVLSGEQKGGALGAVLLNAAAAIYVGDVGGSWSEALGWARNSVDSGAALAKLDALREATNRAS